MTWDPLTEVIVRLALVESGLDRLQDIVDSGPARESEALHRSLLEATAHLLKMGHTLEATFTANAWVELRRKSK